MFGIGGYGFRYGQRTDRREKGAFDILVRQRSKKEDSMSVTVGRLADRLLSLVVPRTTAAAATQAECWHCSHPEIGRWCTRDCVGGVCEPWRCQGCGSC